MNASCTRFASAALLLAAGQALAQPPWYTAKEVTTPAGWENMVPHSLNDMGQVVGEAADPAGWVRGFVWLPSPAYGLPAGATGLTVNPSPSNSTATGINNSGQVSGSGGVGTNVMRWDLASGVNPLPIQVRANGYGKCITDSGVIGGYGAPFSAGCDVAGLFAPGSATPVTNTACTNSYVNAINATGLAVGDLYTGQQLAFFASPPGYVGKPVPNYPGALPSHYVWVRAVNDEGTMVGQINYPPYNGTAAFAFQDANGDQVADPATEYTILNTAGAGECGADAINNAGEVGGHQFSTGRGMLWRNGKEYFLNDCVPRAGGYPYIYEVRAMNHLGQILCRALTAPNQGPRAVVLTPICYANADASLVHPIINVADFTSFLQRFAAAQPYANCDESVGFPTLNVADFSCFLNKFAQGCP